jgi:hypothetical protein
LDRQGAIAVISNGALSAASDDAPLCAKRDYPATRVVRPGEFVWAYCLGQAAPDDLGFAVDGLPYEIAFDSNEDRAKIEPGERLLVGDTDSLIRYWPSPRDDSSHEPACDAGPFHVPYRSGIQKCVGAGDVIFKALRKRLLREAA